MKHKTIKRTTFRLFVILLGIFLLGSILSSVLFGNVSLSVQDVYRVILYEVFHVPHLSGYAEGAVHDVVWEIRLPRVLMAAMIGMGLSVCGVIMQAVVRNPLADPYVLGVSSGAYLGAASSIILGIGSLFGTMGMGIMAFIGAVAASFGVLVISGIGGRAGAGKLILSGMAVSTVCSAIANFLIYIGQNREAVTQISYWSMGSLATADWKRLPWLFLITIAAVLFFWTQSRTLNLMLLGNETSITLGSDLYQMQMLYLVLTALLIGTTVCAAGMIGFVGLIVPHAVRMCVGTDHRRVLPVSALAGAVFLIWADVLSRILLDYAELPIGIVVSLVGAPFFIFLMIRRSYQFGGGTS